MSYSHNTRKKNIKRGNKVINPVTGKLCMFAKIKNVWKLVPVDEKTVNA